MTKPLPDALISYLLAHRTEGFRFEGIVQRLLGMWQGEAFEAIGGQADGGADGILTGVYSSKMVPTNFVQISKEASSEKKIRRTVERLREVGRAPETVALWTNRPVPQKDVMEDKLSRDLKLNVRVRDHGSIVNLVNYSEQTRTYFRSEFSADIEELAEQKQTDAATSKFSKDPTVYTFLKFQLSERQNNAPLLAPVADALIYWALRDTKPDDANPVLLTRQAVKDAIAVALPGAANILLPVVTGRLDDLAKKDGHGQSRLRHYRAQDAFCLPYEMRIALAAEAAQDATLSEQVAESVCARATALGADTSVAGTIAKLALGVVYQHFHEQGLVLSAFLEKRLASLDVDEQVVESELQRVLERESVPPSTYAIALQVLRGLFYEPQEHEQRFLRMLSKTSMLLVSLNHCPRLLEYFNGMTGSFRLLVGADILVKALSERFLPEAQRTVTNLLAAAKAAGATLLLAEPVCMEVFTHLHATHMEFRNHYASREAYISRAIGSQSDRILIRTYFYAKEQRLVKGWGHFVDNFVDFNLLDRKTSQGVAQLQAFMCKAFGLTFVAEKELMVGVSTEAVNALTAALEQRNLSKNRLLARNDALIVLSVYAQRQQRGEAQKYDGFGLSTWWLTKETKILQYTGQHIAESGERPYMMRPEFLLNFLALSPKANLSAKARELLPTHVGLQLGHHLSDRQMETLLSAVEEWKQLPTERIDVKLSEFADTLKYDRLKRYQSNIDDKESNPFEVQLSRLREQLADEAARNPT